MCVLQSKYVVCSSQRFVPRIGNIEEICKEEWCEGTVDRPFMTLLSNKCTALLIDFDNFAPPLLVYWIWYFALPALLLHFLFTYFTYFSIKICSNFNECWLIDIVKSVNFSFILYCQGFFSGFCLCPLLDYDGFKICPPSLFIPPCSVNYFGKSTLLFVYSIHRELELILVPYVPS